MKKEFNAYFGKPKYAMQSSPRLQLLRKIIVFGIVFLVCLALIWFDRNYQALSGPAPSELSVCLQAIQDTANRALLIMFCILAIIAAILGCSCAFSRQPIFLNLQATPITQPHQLSLRINRNGIQAMFTEPYTLAKTPWSKITYNADYTLSYSWGDIQNVRIKKILSRNDYALLVIRGKLECVRIISGTSEKLGWYKARRLIRCPLNPLHIWIPLKLSSEITPELEKYSDLKGTDFE